MPRLPQRLLPLFALFCLLGSQARGVQKALEAGSRRTRTWVPWSQAPDIGARLVPWFKVRPLLGAVDAGLVRQRSGLVRLRQIALEASNGTLSTGVRTSLDRSFQEGIQRVGRIALSTRFEDSRLLAGGEDFLLQVPPPQTGAVFYDAPDTTVSSLSLAGSLSYVTGAGLAVLNVNATIAAIAQHRSDLRATWVLVQS